MILLQPDEFLMLECESKSQALQLLESLPLVNRKMI